MNSTPSPISPCPQCGRALPKGPLGDLCPACLLAQATATESPSADAAPRFQTPPIERVSELFPQLEILELLGAGGMGAVYKARQPGLDRLVALKVVGHPDHDVSAFQERFQREARALARLNHPNIVAVHEFGESGGLLYFLMEFVEGSNLRQLQRNGRLSPREALAIVPQICDALQYAHDAGVVHRDIKPENVLVDPRGRVKIADFGIARIVGSDTPETRLTMEGQVVGTPHYMAPEQLDRPSAVDHRADIFSLGVVFYELLTGELPIGRFPPPSRKVEVDVRLDAIVLRALENDPARRYQHVGEVKTGVETLASQPVPTAGSGGMATSGAKPGIRFRRWLGIPVAKEWNGRRDVSFPGAVGALFACLTVALAGHLAVRVFVGREHALPGFALLAAVGTATWGVRRSMERGADPTEEADDGKLRWPRLRDVLGLAFLFVAVLAADLAKVRWLDPKAGLGRPPIRAEALPGSEGLSARIPGGPEVRLLALSRPGAAAGEFWRPDGSTVRGDSFAVRYPSELIAPGREPRDLILRIRDLPEGAEGPVFASEPDSGHSWGSSVETGGVVDPSLSQLRLSWLPGTRKASLRVGFSVSPWRAVVTRDRATGVGTTTILDREPAWNGFILDAGGTGDGCQVGYRFGPESADWKHRLVALDRGGRVHPATRSSGLAEETGTTRVARFDGLALDAVREFRIEVRPVTWIEFRDVALEPDEEPSQAAPPTSKEAGTRIPAEKGGAN